MRSSESKSESKPDASAPSMHVPKADDQSHAAESSPARLEGGDCKRESGDDVAQGKSQENAVCGDGKTTGNVCPSRSHHTDFVESLPPESNVFCAKSDPPDPAIIGDKRDVVTFEFDGGFVARSRAGSVMSYTDGFAFLKEESSSNASSEKSCEVNTLFESRFPSRNSTLEPNRVGLGGTGVICSIINPSCVSENSNAFSANSKQEGSRNNELGSVRARANKKGRIGPFFVFQKKMRPILMKERPGLTSLEIAKELGSMWKALSHEERDKYQQSPD